MLGRRKKYEYSYWGNESTYVYKSPKQERSLKRKLAIVFSFVFVLAITPSMIYALSNFNLKSSPKVSVVNPPAIITTEIPEAPEIYNVTIEEPKTLNNQAEVIINDSYWKISKRVCGSGKYYISIQSQNGGKALYKGDIVSASCVL